MCVKYVYFIEANIPVACSAVSYSRMPVRLAHSPLVRSVVGQGVFPVGKGSDSRAGAETAHFVSSALTDPLLLVILVVA